MIDTGSYRIKLFPDWIAHGWSWRFTGLKENEQERKLFTMIFWSDTTWYPRNGTIVIWRMTKGSSIPAILIDFDMES